MKDFFWIKQVRKDFLWDISYKISFFGQFIGIFLTVTTFYFISETFIDNQSELLDKYNQNYFVFAVIGICIVDILTIVMRSVSTSIREAQSFGYLDILITSNIRPIYLYFCSSLYPLFKGFLRLMLYLIFMKIFVNLEINLISFLVFIALIILAVLPFFGIAILAGAFVIYFKQSEPIIFFTNIFIAVFSGIVYPVKVMPLWMQEISGLIPLSTILEDMRLIILNESLLNDLSITFYVLMFLFSLIFIIICSLIMSAIIQRVKIDGTLGKY